MSEKRVGYHDLPRTIFGANRKPLRQYSQAELEAAAGPPPTPREPPAHLPEWKRAKLRRLAQYGGWTKEGWLNSVGNLTRKIMSSSNTPPDAFLPPDAPGPLEVPAHKIPPVLGGKGTIAYRTIRACLSQMEWELFVETWNKWFEKHTGDYVYTEDEDDIKTICMETVIQHRLLLLQSRRPKDFDSKALHESHLRLQRARENLGARRADREQIGKNSKPSKGAGVTLNVAVMAGGVDAQQIEQRHMKVIESRQQLDGFFARTTQVTENPLAPQGDGVDDLPALPGPADQSEGKAED